MAIAPLFFPAQIIFSNIVTDSYVKASGGAKTQFSSDIIARIDGDGDGVFSVLGVDIWGLIHEPDAPPRSGPSWEVVDSAVGPGPIASYKGGALSVTVAFSSPNTAAKTSFTASVAIVANGTTAPILMHIPITATIDAIGTMQLTSTPCPLLLDGMLAGRSQDIVLLLQSSLSQDVTGIFSLDPGHAALSAPSTTITVPARTWVNATLNLTCAAGTPQGYIEDVGFSFTSSDPNADAGIAVRLQVVAGRLISFSTQLAPVVPIGGSTYVKVIADDSGGRTMIAYELGDLDFGIAVDVGAPRVTAGGAVPGEEQIVEMDMRIDGVNGSAPGNVPFLLNWTVPADDTHEGLSGALNFDANLMFAGNYNYFLTSQGTFILEPKVTINFETTFASLENGWSIQLNAYSAIGFPGVWQQFVLYSDPGDNNIYGTIETLDVNGNFLVFADPKKVATAPVIKGGYSAIMRLRNWNEVAVTGVFFQLLDELGGVLGETELTIIGQAMYQAPGQTATAANQAPICAFQINIGGHGNYTFAAIDGAMGSISYTADNPLNADLTAPDYVADVNIFTAESSNVFFGPLSSPVSGPQSFQAFTLNS